MPEGIAAMWAISLLHGGGCARIIPQARSRSLPCSTRFPACSCAAAARAAPSSTRPTCPPTSPTRDRVLLAVMGSPDRRQIDGLGGAHPLTSKVGIVRLSKTAGVDLDFLFAQLQPDKDTVDTTPNCGNMLAAVVPFALETGLLKAQGDTTTLRVLTLNTDMQCDITVQTPGGQISYEGDARIDSVPGSSAPIKINFLDTAGSVAPGLLPTGQRARRDRRHRGHLHRQRHAARDVQGQRRGPHRLRDGGADERRHRAEGPHRAAAHRRRPCDEAGRRDEQELPQDDADRRAAARRQP